MSPSAMKLLRTLIFKSCGRCGLLLYLHTMNGTISASSRFDSRSIEPSLACNACFGSDSTAPSNEDQPFAGELATYRCGRFHSEGV